MSKTCSYSVNIQCKEVIKKCTKRFQLTLLLIFIYNPKVGEVNSLRYSKSIQKNHQIVNSGPFFQDYNETSILQFCTLSIYCFISKPANLASLLSKIVSKKCILLFFISISYENYGPLNTLEQGLGQQPRFRSLRASIRVG